MISQQYIHTDTETDTETHTQVNCLPQFSVLGPLTQTFVTYILSRVLARQAKKIIEINRICTHI